MLQIKNAMNFDFLKEQNGYYDLFADACIEAEKVFSTSPAMCAVGCRKALELAVKSGLRRPLLHQHAL